MKIIYTTLLLLTINWSFACDVCGCSLSGFSMGLLPNLNNPFIGVRLSQAQFNSSTWHTGETKNFETSKDNYYRSDFVGRINLTERLKLNIQAPIVYNTMSSNHEDLETFGVGDPSLLFSLKILKDSLFKGAQNLMLSSGVKFPLGNFTSQTDAGLINPNFQNGSGSFDFILNANYSYRKKIAGLNVESSYKMNTANKFEYKFGNQLNAAINNFYFFETKKLAHLYYAGIYFEKANRHTIQKKNIFNTGGYGMYSTIGTQIYLRNFRLGARCQLPLIQNFYTDNLTEINAKPRFEVDCIFFFGGKK